MMHAQTEPAGQPTSRSVGRTAGRLGVVCAALFLNSAAASLTASVALAAAAAVLALVGEPTARSRVRPWLLAAALGVGAAHALERLGIDLRPAAWRTIAGTGWLLWGGAGLEWADLRALLQRLGTPSAALQIVDRTLLHGVETAREWGERRDAARCRAGRARLPTATWAALIGEGADAALLRATAAEEAAALRAAPGHAAAAPAAVDARSVTVVRGGDTVLDAIGFTIAPGEWVALGGVSGSGKSSLLRLLGGLDAPGAGVLHRRGRAVSPNAPLGARLDGDIGVLFQNAGHQLLAGRVDEDIGWTLSVRGRPPDEVRSRVVAVAARLGIGHLLHRPCHAISHGEQRRVALAGLLVAEPAILLLDEPTAGLDPVASFDLVRAVAAEARAGLSVVWATHELDALPPQIRRVLLIARGRLIFDGPTEEGLSPGWRRRAGLLPPCPEAPHV